MKTRIGVIGLGIIGSRAAANLRKKGHSVYVWNRSPKNIPNFLGSASEVARSADILQFFVSDDAALISAVESIAADLTSDHVLLFHPTVLPETILAAGEIATRAGARFLEAPFTGSKGAAEAGQLVYYVAGDEALVREIEPLLLDTGKAVVPIGKPGQAAIVKIVTNLMSASVLNTLGEIFTLANAAGITPEKLRDALAVNANWSPLLAMKLPGIIEGNFEPHFSVRHMTKDVRHGEKLAAQYGVPTPAIDAARNALISLVEHGDGDADYSIIAKIQKSR
ncbi:MAG TPA: NAD(P)-dependent oxidoreductase [Chthoniobacterales bacterium]